MKIWEMLKVLGESPEKTFESRDSFGTMECKVEEGFIGFTREGYPARKILLDGAWTEVSVPLKLEDVISMVSGKIRDYPTLFKLDLDGIVLQGSLDEIIYQLGVNYDSYVISKFLTQGKWYVE